MLKIKDRLKLYNDVWEAFDAEFYKEVKSIMRKAYRGAADALD